jgi:predicted dehydrogenase
VSARIGLVGCGRLGVLGYAPALRRADGVELVAVADPEPARRAAVLSAHGDLRAGRVMAFPTLADLLSGCPVDAVILATPAGLHLADAERATSSGVAVLVEKPPAPDRAGAVALAALDPAPWLGLNRRFDPGARAVRDGAAGLDRHTTDLSISYRRRSWGAHGAPDDALLDLGPHLVDWARWLVDDEPVAVRAAAVEHDRVDLDVEMRRGRTRIRARADRLHEERIEVRDGDGAAVARHTVGGPIAAVTGRLRPGPHPLQVSLTGQVEALGRALAGTHEPDLGVAADGVAVMAVIEAARASAAAGGARRPVTTV